MVEKWFAHFEGGRTNTDDAECSGPPNLAGLLFCTNLWGCVSYFRNGCRVCSHSTKNNNASRIQSAVCSSSREVKRIFCVAMWQWMKYGSTTTHLKQKDHQLSGQQLVKAVQNDQKLNSGLPSLWQLYFGTRMVFFLSIILRQVKPLTATITWHYWIDWAQKSQKSRKNGLVCKRKKCCFIKKLEKRWNECTTLGGNYVDK